MGADDYHVSALATLEKEIGRRDKGYVLKRIEKVAYKWDAGEISDKRMAEAVFGLVNGGVRT